MLSAEIWQWLWIRASRKKSSKPKPASRFGLSKFQKSSKQELLDHGGHQRDCGSDSGLVASRSVAARKVTRGKAGRIGGGSRCRAGRWRWCGGGSGSGGGREDRIHGCAHRGGRQ